VLHPLPQLTYRWMQSAIETDTQREACHVSPEWPLLRPSFERYRFLREDVLAGARRRCDLFLVLLCGVASTTALTALSGSKSSKLSARRISRSRQNLSTFADVRVYAVINQISFVLWTEYTSVWPHEPRAIIAARNMACSPEMVSHESIIYRQPREVNT
jgi:hypothetical protein